MVIVTHESNDGVLVGSGKQKGLESLSYVFRYINTRQWYRTVLTTFPLSFSRSLHIAGVYINASIFAHSLYDNDLSVRPLKGRKTTASRSRRLPQENSIIKTTRKNWVGGVCGEVRWDEVRCGHSAAVDRVQRDAAGQCQPATLLTRSSRARPDECAINCTDVLVARTGAPLPPPLQVSAPPDAAADNDCGFLHGDPRQRQTRRLGQFNSVATGRRATACDRSHYTHTWPRRRPACHWNGGARATAWWRYCRPVARRPSQLLAS